MSYKDINYISCSYCKDAFNVPQWLRDNRTSVYDTIMEKLLRKTSSPVKRTIYHHA